MSTVGRGVVVGTDPAGLATGVEAPATATTTLRPGYPNPFAALTTLRYTLERPGPVRLAVYDVLGRRVAVLADGVRSAGSHTVRFDAAGLPAGVYFGRLEAGGRVHTRRLMLVR